MPNVQVLLLSAVSALLVAFMAGAVVWGEKGVLRFMELKSELRTANTDLRSIELENQRLLRTLHTLEDDRIVVERVVAEDLGWATEGTTLYHFDDAEPSRHTGTNGAAALASP